MGKRILFIAQEIAPFVPDSHMSVLGKVIPRALAEDGYEIRSYHPKWGNINERRNQLHEVIRLSGMNTIIDDTDHQLLIKVASMPYTKMQVYFIDNEDFFFKRLAVADKNGVEYNDNYERAVFYARSVLEITKKVRWYPDLILCQGWMSCVAPFLIKTVYKDEPAYHNAKVITSLHQIDITKPMPERFPYMMAFRNVTAEDAMSYGLEYKKPADLQKLALRFSDAAVVADKNVDPDVVDYARQRGITVAQYSDDPTDKDNGKVLEKIFSQFIEDKEEK